MQWNRTVYESVREQLCQECAGRYVALGEGRIRAVAATYDEAVADVQRLNPVPDFFLVFAAGQEPDFEPFYDQGTTP